MKLIFRNAKIMDPGGQWHEKQGDLLLEDGRIAKFGQNLSIESARSIELPNLHISPGWFDSGICIGEPGREERETLANGLWTAALSGFTDVAIQPTGVPATDNASQVAWILSKSMNLGARAHIVANLTRDAKGRDLAEIFDMQQAGAIAFGDYNKNLDDANLLKIALQYAGDLRALIIAYSMDASLASNGLVNEGVAAANLGLRGIPTLAEELALARNLMLLEYTGGRLHIPTISTAASADLIRKAKQKGLDVTASASVHHLLLDDSTLSGFDTHYKVTPPLRTKQDISALREAVLDGTIDMITTDHNPIDIEHKKVEFALAENGTIGLESAFGALGKIFDTHTIVAKFTAGRESFGLEKVHLTEGAQTSITLFDPDHNWKFSKEHILSKSKNSAFIDFPMQGWVYGSVIGNKTFLKDEN